MGDADASWRCAVPFIAPFIDIYRADSTESRKRGVGKAALNPSQLMGRYDSLGLENGQSRGSARVPGPMVLSSMVLSSLMSPRC